MDLPLCSPLRLFRITGLSAMCLLASSGLVTAEEAAQPPEKAEPVLKYDPEFPDSMVVATINSVPITVDDVLAPYKHTLEVELRNHGIPAAARREARTAVVKRLLPYLIDRKLRVYGLTSKLNETQRSELDEHLDKAWEQHAAQLRKEAGVSTMEELADKVREEDGYDLATVKRHWRDADIADQFAARAVDSSYAPKSRELHDYYEEHRGEWECPVRVKWQQIVVCRNKGEERAVAKDRAEEILKKLTGGADFAELARAYSQGATKKQGGSWEWTEPAAIACRDVGEFLSASKVGSTSAVIANQDDFHIVRVLSREEAGGKSFEEAEDEIRGTLIKAEQTRQLHEAVRELADKAVIKTVFGDDWKFTQESSDASLNITVDVPARGER